MKNFPAWKFSSFEQKVQKWSNTAKLRWIRAQVGSASCDWNYQARSRFWNWNAGHLEQERGVQESPHEFQGLA